MRRVPEHLTPQPWGEHEAATRQGRRTQPTSRRMDSTRINKYICSHCGYGMTYATGLEDESIPVEGDLSICLKCGDVTAFTAGLEGVREIPAEEWQKIRSEHPESWRKIQKARELIRRRRRRGDWIK